jgi:hypothetical protein
VKFSGSRRFQSGSEIQFVSQPSQANKAKSVKFPGSRRLLSGS